MLCPGAYGRPEAGQTGRDGVEHKDGGAEHHEHSHAHDGQTDHPPGGVLGREQLAGGPDAADPGGAAKDEVVDQLAEGEPQEERRPVAAGQPQGAHGQRGGGVRPVHEGRQ